VARSRDSRGRFVATGIELNLKDKMSPKMRTVARGVAASFSAIKDAAQSVVVAFGEMTKAAAAFELGMAEVSTLVDTAVVDMKQLKTAAMEFSTAFGKSATDQASSFYQAISAGATSAAEATAVVGTANKLAVAGLTSTETAVDGLTSVLNAYSADMRDAATVSDIFFEAVRIGKTTVPELANNIGKVAPTAAQAGVNLSELAAAIAAVTKAGVQTDKAAIAINQILTSVIKQSPKAVREAHRLGVDFSLTAVRAKGLSGFLKEIAGNSKLTEASLGRLFGNVRALRGVFALLRGNMEDFTGAMEATADATGSTDEAFIKINRTMGFQIERFENLREASSIALGEAATDSQVLNTALIQINRQMSRWVANTRDANEQENPFDRLFNSLASNQNILAHTVGQFATIGGGGGNLLVQMSQLLKKNRETTEASLEREKELRQEALNFARADLAIEGDLKRFRADLASLQEREFDSSIKTSELVAKQVAKEELIANALKEQRRLRAALSSDITKAALDEARAKALQKKDIVAPKTRKLAKGEDDDVKNTLFSGAESGVNTLGRVFERFFEDIKDGIADLAGDLSETLLENLSADEIRSGLAEVETALADEIEGAKRLYSDLGEVRRELEEEMFDAAKKGQRDRIKLLKDEIQAIDESFKGQAQKIKDAAGVVSEFRRAATASENKEDRLKKKAEREEDKKRRSLLRDHKRAMAEIKRANEEVTDSYMDAAFGAVDAFGQMGAAALRGSLTGTEAFRMLATTVLNSSAKIVQALFTENVVKKTTATSNIIATGNEAAAQAGKDAGKVAGPAAPFVIPAVIAAVLGLFATLVQGFNKGGLVTGGKPGEDSVPAMLTPGEFVLPRETVDDIRSGRGPRRPSSAPGRVGFAQGGMVPKLGRQMGAGTVVIAPQINQMIPARNTQLRQTMIDSVVPSLSRLLDDGVKVESFRERGSR